jgi:hypothetical protein
MEYIHIFGLFTKIKNIMTDLQANLNAWAQAGIRDGYTLPSRQNASGLTVFQIKRRRGNALKDCTQLKLF